MLLQISYQPLDFCRLATYIEPLTKNVLVLTERLRYHLALDRNMADAIKYHNSFMVAEEFSTTLAIVILTCG